MSVIWPKYIIDVPNWGKLSPRILVRDEQRKE
jgi:hypothetical protein